MAKIQLIEGWRKSWRLASMQVAGAITGLAAVWMSLPDEVKAVIPDKYKPVAVLVGGLAVGVARVIRQEPKDSSQ